MATAPAAVLSVPHYSNGHRNAPPVSPSSHLGIGVSLFSFWRALSVLFLSPFFLRSLPLKLFSSSFFLLLFFSYHPPSAAFVLHPLFRLL